MAILTITCKQCGKRIDETVTIGKYKTADILEKYEWREIPGGYLCKVCNK